MEWVEYKPDLKHLDLKTVDIFHENIQEKLNDVILTAASEAIHIAAQNSYTFFPIQYRSCGSDGYFGEPINDPLEMYVCLEVASDCCTPAYKFNLSNAVDELISSGAEDIDDIKKELAKALRGLADKLDAA